MFHGYFKQKFINVYIGESQERIQNFGKAGLVGWRIQTSNFGGVMQCYSLWCIFIFIKKEERK